MRYSFKEQKQISDISPLYYYICIPKHVINFKLSRVYLYHWFVVLTKKKKEKKKRKKEITNFTTIKIEYKWFLWTYTCMYVTSNTYIVKFENNPVESKFLYRIISIWFIFVRCEKIQDIRNHSSKIEHFGRYTRNSTRQRFYK